MLKIILILASSISFLQSQDLILENLIVDGQLRTPYVDIVRTKEEQTITCENIETNNIETHQLTIQGAFSTKELLVNYISPLHLDQKQEEIVEGELEVQESVEESSFFQKKMKREPNTIQLHGKFQFKKGIIKTDNHIQTDFYLKRKSLKDPEFIQIGDESQWMPVVAEDFSEKHTWKVIHIKEDYEEMDTQDVKRSIKKKLLHYQNDLKLIKNKEWMEEQLKKFSFLIKEEAVVAKTNQILHFSYHNLPKQHSYIQIIGNFYFFSEFWRKDSKVWMKVNKELVWIQPHQGQNSKGICQFLQSLSKNFYKHDHELSEDKKKVLNEHIQKEIDALQNIYWSIPINLAVKHFSDVVSIEIGVTVGKLPNSCTPEEVLLFQLLEENMHLFGFDDFMLSYK